MKVGLQLNLDEGQPDGMQPTIKTKPRPRTYRGGDLVHE